MRVVINTPDEFIGRTVVAGLLENRARATIIGRNSRQMAMAVGQGARLVEGTMDDEKALTRALVGSDTLFWQTPLVSRPDLHQWAVATAEMAAATARACGVQRVVNVSTAGAPGGKGTGLVSALLRIENIFRDACRNTVNLRPGVIMETTFGRFRDITSDQTLDMPLHAHKPLPMVSAADVGQVAVDYLLNTAWFGHLTVDVTGPKEVTPAEATAILATEMGTDLKYRQTTMAETRRKLRARGRSNYEADAILEMFETIGDGRFDAREPRVSRAVTTTHLEDVVKARMETKTKQDGKRAE